MTSLPPVGFWPWWLGVIGSVGCALTVVWVRRTERTLPGFAPWIPLAFLTAGWAGVALRVQDLPDAALQVPTSRLGDWSGLWTVALAGKLAWHAWMASLWMWLLGWAGDDRKRWLARCLACSAAGGTAIVGMLLSSAPMSWGRFDAIQWLTPAVLAFACAVGAAAAWTRLRGRTAERCIALATALACASVFAANARTVEMYKPVDGSAWDVDPWPVASRRIANRWSGGCAIDEAGVGQTVGWTSPVLHPRPCPVVPASLSAAIAPTFALPNDHRVLDALGRLAPGAGEIGFLVSDGVVGRPEMWSRWGFGRVAFSVFLPPDPETGTFSARPSPLRTSIWVHGAAESDIAEALRVLVGSRGRRDLVISPTPQTTVAELLDACERAKRLQPLWLRCGIALGDVGQWRSWGRGE